MQNKIKIAILYGGKSAEHEISIRSAESIEKALDKEKYEITKIFIAPSGKWQLENKSKNILLAPESNGELTVNGEVSAQKIDVVFPVLHGPFGEDGTVQGLLKLAGIPFVGPSVLGSSIGMDKDVTKRLLKEAGIPIPKFITTTQSKLPSYVLAKETLGNIIFVKPANLGSSVGVHKVTNEQEYQSATINAFSYDTKILLEEFIEGREIECSVLGNEDPISSLPGEIIPTHDFYSYDAKYTDQNGAKYEIPAKLDEITTKKIQDLSIKSFKTLCCEGMSRVDFFLKPNGEILVNEINTIPGFTSISMYPKMWEASGLPYSKLLDKLIDLAIKRHQTEQKLLTNRS